MAEGSNRESLTSSPNRNSDFMFVIKKDYETDPRQINNPASAMEIGPFVSAEVNNSTYNMSVNTTNRMQEPEKLWKEAEHDDLLFQDTESEDGFVWDSARGGGTALPRLNLLEDMQQSKSDDKVGSKESDRLLTMHSDGLYSEYNAHEHHNGTVVQTDYEDPLWHCHQDTPAKVDRVARNQLIAISVICVIFMIGEIVGMIYFCFPFLAIYKVLYTCWHTNNGQQYPNSGEKVS